MTKYSNQGHIRMYYQESGWLEGIRAPLLWALLLEFITGVLLLAYSQPPSLQISCNLHRQAGSSVKQLLPKCSWNHSTGVIQESGFGERWLFPSISFNLTKHTVYRVLKGLTSSEGWLSYHKMSPWIQLYNYQYYGIWKVLRFQQACSYRFGIIHTDEWGLWWMYYLRQMTPSSLQRTSQVKALLIKCVFLWSEDMRRIQSKLMSGYSSHLYMAVNKVLIKIT